jgi:hypothetical protein
MSHESVLALSVELELVVVRLGSSIAGSGGPRCGGLDCECTVCGLVGTSHGDVPEVAGWRE